jgi:hypothetical protein
MTARENLMEAGRRISRSPSPWSARTLQAIEHMKWTLVAFALIAAAPLACTANNGGGAANDLIGRRQCSWSSSLDDAGSTGCHAAAAFVECKNAAGEGCACLSDNSLTCDGCQAVGATCRDVCAADQYAVACGGVGPGAGAFTPPAGCTSAGVTPGGVGYYCCPCQ